MLALLGPRVAPGRHSPGTAPLNPLAALLEALMAAPLQASSRALENRASQSGRQRIWRFPT
jgi:hypothetical protein